MRIVHDGCEATRAEKTAWIAERYPSVLKHLHVCIMLGRDGTANCGSCKKCVRTMVALAAVGMLDRAPTFPQQLPRDLEENVAQDSFMMILQNLQLAVQSGADGPLVATLDRLMRRRRRDEAMPVFAENTSARYALPLLRYLRSIIRGAPRPLVASAASMPTAFNA
jgi:hypothetical protein